MTFMVPYTETVGFMWGEITNYPIPSLTLEKSPMNVLFVAQNSAVIRFLLIKWALIVEITHIYVLLWQKKSILRQVCQHIWEVMVVKSHPHVLFVVKKSRRKSLNSLVGVHCKEEQFECSVCGKIYSNSSTRNYHMRTQNWRKATRMFCLCRKI